MPDISRTPAPAPKAPKSGKGAAILVRVTQDLRTSIDAEAARTGRSISQVVEHAIVRGRALGDLGGDGVADAIQAMLKAAQDIRDTTGNPTTSIPARDALRARWTKIAAEALPIVVQQDAGEEAAAAAVSAMRFAAIDALESLSAALKGDPMVEKCIGAIARARLHPGAAGWKSAREQMERFAGGLSDRERGSINGLLQMAGAAEAMVKLSEQRSHERS